MAVPERPPAFAVIVSVAALLCAVKRPLEVIEPPLVVQV